MIFASIDLNRENLEEFLESLESIKQSKFSGIEICLWENMNKYSNLIKKSFCTYNLQSNVHNDLMRMEEGINKCKEKLEFNLNFKKNINAKFFITHPIKPYLSNLEITKRLFEGLKENILLENVRGIKLLQTKFFDMPLVLDIGNLIKNKEFQYISDYHNVQWVHIHDYIDEQDHLPLGEGNLKLSEIVNMFHNMGFTIEMGSKFRKWSELRDKYRNSIDFLNNLLIFNESYGRNIRLKHLLNHIGQNRLDTVIDFGCGEGYLLHNVNARNKKGYDLFPKEIFNDIVYIKQDSIIPLQKCADLAICSEVIEHVAEDNKLLKNIYNSLISGGRVFLTTINNNTSEDKSKLDKERLHFRRYGKELKGFMELHGFRTLSFYPFRSKHYYDNKNNIKAYSCEEDIIQGRKNASGWVYFGIK